MNSFQAVTILWMAANVSFTGEPREDLAEDRFNSSQQCGECHREIHSMWQRSMHSAAYTDPIFQSSYLQAYLETRGEAKTTCLRCHAPMAALTSDWDLIGEIGKEGITCDFCHSVVSVDLDRHEQPFRVEFDGVKRGPLGDADSPAHEVAKSPLHQSAEFCAGCHEYVNDQGIAVLSTYSEWRLSPQAKEGKTCQHCHMPEVPGETVREEFETRRGSINLHNISGGHSTEQVRKAATGKILTVRREEPSHGVVEVEVANIGSGHSIPTGLPTRRLVLEVILYVDGLEVRRFEKTYRKALLDREGNLLSKDHRVMLEAVKIMEDNRLKAGERRLERFVSRIPRTGKLEAKMRLRYLYEPEILTRETISIDMALESSNSSHR